MQRYSPIAPCFVLKSRGLAAGALSWDPAESAEQKLHSQLLFPNINNQHTDDFFKYEYCAQFLITILNCTPINSHILIKERACTYRDLELLIFTPERLPEPTTEFKNITSVHLEASNLFEWEKSTVVATPKRQN